MSKFAELPVKVRDHLKSMAESSAITRTDQSLESLADNWLRKQTMFESQTRLLEMERIGLFLEGDARGVILLTYSGSLVAIGPLSDKSAGRWLEYASIQLRKDVPPLVHATGIAIVGPIEPDRPARFSSCALAKSSEVLSMAVCPAGLSRSEEDRRLREASVFLTNGFIKLNRTIHSPEDKIGHFTIKTMVRYVAQKNDITQTLARQVIEDYVSTIEAGALLGERVPVGSIGWLKLGARPIQKARLGRNPATGEQMLIAAKPELSVPKFSFNARIKERAATVPPPAHTEDTE